MAMFEKIKKTMSDRDMDAYMELVHEDAVFVFHKSGNNFSKSEWGDMAKGMLANEKFVQESSRCVYENEDYDEHGGDIYLDLISGSSNIKEGLNDEGYFESFIINN